MRRVILLLLILVGTCFNLAAQFKNGATATNTSSLALPPGAEQTGNKVNPDSDVPADSTSGFSMKRLIRGFARKDSLTQGYMLLGSAILPGIGQIYNKDYWKLPIIYGGIGAGVYFGINNNVKYQETGDKKYATYSAMCYIGAAATYWGSLMDGVISFDVGGKEHIPSKAAIYSALLPGLGQIYNGDYWKIPIWYGGFVACGYFYHLNDIQYQRFRYIYRMDNDPNSGYYGGITASQAEWYKDTYRRYRDYSIIAFVLVYALNIIDANVFAYMHDFDVSDNLAVLNIQPAVITPINMQFTSNANSTPALGFQMQLKF